MYLLLIAWRHLDKRSSSVGLFIYLQPGATLFWWGALHWEEHNLILVVLNYTMLFFFLASVDYLILNRAYLLVKEQNLFYAIGLDGIERFKLNIPTAKLIGISFTSTIVLGLSVYFNLFGTLNNDVAIQRCIDDMNSASPTVDSDKTINSDIFSFDSGSSHVSQTLQKKMGKSYVQVISKINPEQQITDVVIELTPFTFNQTTQQHCQLLQQRLMNIRD